MNKAEVSDRIRRFGLGCMVEFRQGGLITLLHDNPIDERRVALAFPYPDFEINNFGRREVKMDRPDIYHCHYFVDIRATNEINETTC
jgi:hypothetical protein